MSTEHTSGGSFRFEGRDVAFTEGDSIASALYRVGIRTFTRSFKYHRRRGLYCLTGDCPNCMVSVDGDPAVRSCTTEACGGLEVEREDGFPSTEVDLLSIMDRMHALTPVGFYYKTFIRPRFAWEAAEKIIRNATGLGKLPLDREPDLRDARHVHCSVLVIGGGLAGLASAKAASDAGAAVVLCDEGSFGEKIAPGATRDRIDELVAELRGRKNVQLLERHVAIGLYESPLVPLSGPDGLVRVHPARVIVATGAVEAHAVFEGNDVPGVWLGRGAARMAGVHGERPGDKVLAVVATEEALQHLDTIRGLGVELAAVIATSEFADRVPEGLEVLRDAEVVRVKGKELVRAAVVRDADGRQRTITCDAVVVSLGLAPRDGLLRMGAGQPVIGAGDVVQPGCTPEEAEFSGVQAAEGNAPPEREPSDPGRGTDGFVCLCEDVSMKDLNAAWEEGWQSSEILKRYTTTTMGPCQGALCGRHLSCFATEKSGGSTLQGHRTTARPPARAVKLEQLAAGIHEVIDKRTALHDRHLEMGAYLDWSGSWKRPFNYGDANAEYHAVRDAVSVMDVSTLGKMLIVGPDATELLDRVFPARMDSSAVGRSRYVLALDEAGYVKDDGLACRIDETTWYLTSTSGGADGMEAWLRNWLDRWNLNAHVINQTAMLGAINVAGPRARDLLERLSDDAVDAGALPTGGHAEITVAGVPCRAVRAGFVGELSYELHHSRSQSVKLWDALLAEGSSMGIRPHGLDALEILRLEKGHIYLAQDTLPDDTPAKLGMHWAVAMDKPDFIGKVALERMSEFPIERKLVGLQFDRAPERGAPLYAGDKIVGRVTSCEWSGALGASVGLGWLRSLDGEFVEQLLAGDIPARVVPTPFYDPEGARQRV